LDFGGLYRTLSANLLKAIYRFLKVNFSFIALKGFGLNSPLYGALLSLLFICAAYAALTACSISASYQLKFVSVALQNASISQKSIPTAPNPVALQYPISSSSKNKCLPASRGGNSRSSPPVLA
jgi:hypothetical protein